MVLPWVGSVYPGNLWEGSAHPDKNILVPFLIGSSRIHSQPFPSPSTAKLTCLLSTLQCSEQTHNANCFFFVSLAASSLSKSLVEQLVFSMSKSTNKKFASLLYQT
jgi:hypothetical protein